MVNRIFNPRSYNKNTIGRKRTSIQGGSLLLQKGGPGVGSSYTSTDEYHETTGRGMDGVNAKLRSLMEKPMKKKKNIKFSLN